jgi:TRAP-type uncharacterized transport system substrate-binding protein
VKKLLLVFYILFSYLYATDLGVIATASKRGLYYAIGNDISKEVAKSGDNLNVIPTAGSLANLDILANLTKVKGCNFALCQYDVLILQNIQLRKQKKSIFDNYRLVSPMHKEIIHAISYKGNNIDFKSKDIINVSCGKRNSGSCMSAKLISKLSGKKFRFSYLGFKKSIKLLKEKKLDLVISVIGEGSKKISSLKDLELVSIPKYKKLNSIYGRSKIKKGDYKIATKDITTYNVNSVLITNKDTDSKKVKLLHNALRSIKLDNKYNKIWQKVSLDNIYPIKYYHKSIKNRQK